MSPPNTQAFAAACLPHRGALLGSATRLTRNPDDAEDLVQETLLRAFRAWSRFEDGSVGAWLHRIMCNAYISLYRRRVVAARGLADLGAQGPTYSDPIGDAVRASLHDEVAGALDALGPEYRTLVEDVDLRGTRYTDAAESSGLPAGTVMSRLYRARRKLEEALGPYAEQAYGIRRERHCRPRRQSGAK